MTHNHARLLLMALFLTLASAALASTTWYVNGVSGSDGNNCLSATSACKTIGHAISLSASGDSIKIAAATYKEHLTIGLSMTILGASAGTTVIDGGTDGRVVTISSSSAHVTLSKVTIRNGHDSHTGGGISNPGTLTLVSSTVSGNTASLNCSLNCSAFGGGIFNIGTMTIINSTLSGNSAVARCYKTGCYTSAHGGGIFNEGTLTISNSTLSGNSAIARNLVVGGIYNGGTARFQNTIIANNSGGNCGGTMVSNGYNLSSDGTCTLNNTGDLNNTDPMLGPLQYNGGPTQTMALPSGSPAVDAGNPNGCTDGLGHLLKTDQRGKPRPDAEETAGCDIGAYEYQGALQGGHCVWVCGSTRCGMLTGSCVGSVNNACRSTYDPAQCPVGQPTRGSGSSCGESIDPTRTCTP